MYLRHKKLNVNQVKDFDLFVLLLRLNLHLLFLCVELKLQIRIFPKQKQTLQVFILDSTISNLWQSAIEFISPILWPMIHTIICASLYVNSRDDLKITKKIC